MAGIPDDHVPLALLSFVERRLTESQKVMNDRVDELMEQISANREHSDLRHDETNANLAEAKARMDALMQSWSAWEAGQKKYVQPCDAIHQINTAFIKDDLNRPDYNGHRLRDKQMIETSGELRKTMRQIVLTVVIAAVVSVSAWVYISLKSAAIEHISQQQQGQR